MRYKVMFFLALFLSNPFILHAESQNFYLGKAIGVYLGIVDARYQLEKTECAYVIGRRHNVYIELQNITPFLNANDLEDIKQMLGSDKFRQLSNNHYNDAISSIHEAKKNNIEINNFCIQLNNYLESLYNSAKSDLLLHLQSQ